MVLKQTKQIKSNEIPIPIHSSPKQKNQKVFSPKTPILQNFVFLRHKKNQKNIKQSVKKKHPQNIASNQISEKNFFSKDNVRLQVWILIILSIVLYFNTLFYDYTLDDLLMITGNEYTTQGLKWEGGVKEILFSDALSGFLGKNKNLLPGGRYRPLSQLCFSFEYELFGENPFVGHLINVLLYSLTSVLVFLLLRKLFKPNPKKTWLLSIPFLAALLFVAHPLHTEVVANIKGRDELFSLFFNVLLINFSIDYIRKKKIKYLILLPFIFFLGILSKENTLTFLAVIPLTLFVFTKAKIKDYVLVISGLSLGLIAYFILRYQALGFLMNSVPNYELLNSPFMDVEKLGKSKYATLFFTYAVYLKLMFFPHPLTHDYYPYHIELTTWSNPVSIISIIIYVALIVYAIRKIWKKDIIAYGILFYLIVFSIASNILVNIGAFMNERFIFIALLGFTIVIAYLISEKLILLFKDEKTYKRFATVLVLLIILAFSIKTISRNCTWKDDFTLFTTDVKTSVNSVKCNTSAAGMLINKSQKEKNIILKNKNLNQSITYLKHALDIHPKYVAAWILLGNAYSALDNYELARYYYDNALKLSHLNKDALNNMLYVAQTTAKNKDYPVAIKSYKTLIRLVPKNFDYQYDLASIYLDLNKVDTSIIILNNILAADSNFYKAYSKLGEIYGKYLKDIDVSYYYLLLAYEINPNDVSTLENLGIVHGMKGNYQKSLEHFDMALKFEPNNFRIYVNIGSTYQNMGKLNKAKEYFAKAEELKSKQ